MECPDDRGQKANQDIQYTQGKVNQDAKDRQGLKDARVRAENPATTVRRDPLVLLENMAILVGLGNGVWLEKWECLVLKAYQVQMDIIVAVPKCE